MRRFVLWTRVAWWALLVGVVELLIGVSTMRHRRAMAGALLMAGLVGTAALVHPAHTAPPVRHVFILRGPGPTFELPTARCAIDETVSQPSQLPELLGTTLIAEQSAETAPAAPSDRRAPQLFHGPKLFHGPMRAMVLPLDRGCPPPPAADGALRVELVSATAVSGVAR